MDSSLEVVRQLLAWFESANLRDRVTRILLLWVFTTSSFYIYWSCMIIGCLSFTLTLFQVNNHFTDFELDSDMMELLDGFESRLESSKMQVSRISFDQILHDITPSYLHQLLEL